MNKQDTLLALIALSGELPADLAEFVIGSSSYTAAVLTRFKQEGYILVRNKAGHKGYVLRAKGKRYVLSKFGEDTKDFLQGAAETNHVKGEIEKRLFLSFVAKRRSYSRKLWKTGGGEQHILAARNSKGGQTPSKVPGPAGYCWPGSPVILFIIP